MKETELNGKNNNTNKTIDWTEDIDQQYSDLKALETTIKQFIKDKPESQKKLAIDAILDTLPAENRKYQKELHEDILKSSIVDWNKVKDDKLSFIDRYNFIPQNRLTVVSGQKGAGKTHCILSLLAELDQKFLYFSDGDNMPVEIKKIMKAFNKLAFCSFLDFKSFMEQKTLSDKLDYLLGACHKTKSQIVYLDPFEAITSDSNSSDKVAYALGTLQNFAYENEITIIFSKNFKKIDSSKNLQSIREAISGSHKWTSIPRSVLIVNRVQKGANFYPAEQGTVETEFSLLWQLESNRGITENKLPFKWDENKKVLIPQSTIQFPNYEIFNRCFRKERDIEKEQTQEKQILQHIIEHKTESCGKIKVQLAEKLKVSIKTIERRIKPFINKNWIEIKGKSPKIYDIKKEKDCQNFLDS